VLGPCDSLADVPSRNSEELLSRLHTGVLADPGRRPDRITSAPLMSGHLRTVAREMTLDALRRVDPAGAPVAP
jgi:hypothetical protein